LWLFIAGVLRRTFYESYSLAILLIEVVSAKRKNPRKTPEEQFMRFLEIAKELDVDKKEAEKAFSQIAKKSPLHRKTNHRDSICSARGSLWNIAASFLPDNLSVAS